MPSSDEPRQVFIYELRTDGCGKTYTISGSIEVHRAFPDSAAIRLKDATGAVWVQIPKSNLTALRSSRRIRVTGTLRASTRNSNEVALHCDSDPQSIADLDAPDSELDTRMREQLARVLMGRAIRVISNELEQQRFTPFDSRMISTTMADHGLEGMQVVYPGFGSPVALVTSPASQIREFLIITGRLRAFTVGTSFSTTFRLANASNEERVVMGLALDLSDEEHESLLRELGQKVLSDLGDGSSVTEEYSHPVQVVNREVEHTLTSETWPANLHRWLQIVTSDGWLIAEGAVETLGDSGRLSSFTFYPNQVLGCLEHSPERRLEDLGKTHGWRA